MEEKQPQSNFKIHNLSRREFLRQGAAIGAGLGAAVLLSETSKVQAAPAQPESIKPTNPETLKLTSHRKVIIKGLKGDTTISSVGPAWDRLGTQRSIEGEDLISESVPVVNEATDEPGGIWIDYSPNSNIYSEPDSGVYLPVFAAPEGHDLVIDLEGPGIGYYQLNIHSLEEKIRQESLTPKRKVGVAIVDSGIDPNEPAMAEGIASGVIKFTEGLNTVNPNDSPLDYGYHHGILVTDIILRYSPKNPNTLALYPVNVGEGAGTWNRIQSGIKWAADHPDISLVNLSYWASPKKGDLDFETQKRVAEELKSYANSKDTFIIGSAGNEGETEETAEEAVTGFVMDITVGALHSGGRVMDYSNYDPDVVGPTKLQATAALEDADSSINVSNQPEKTAFFWGTSAASPGIVAVAVWNYIFTEAPMEEIIKVINSPDGTTDIYGPTSPENRRDGHGLVDALKVYNALKQKGY